MKPLFSSQKTLFLKGIYLGIHFCLIATLIVIDQPSTLTTWAYTIGKACGFMGITNLVVQFVLGSRITWLEHGVGLDRFFRWHKNNAKLATILLIIHPILVFYDPLFRAGVRLGELLQFITPGIFLGELALVLILTIVFTSLYAVTLRLSYERWKWVHKLVYGVIILGFLHSFSVGTDILLRNALFYWWVTLVIMVGYAVIYRYGWRIYYRRDNRYKVVDIIQETPTVRTFKLTSLTDKKLIYAPGQFAFTRIFSENLSSEEHHFTLSSSPLEETISFSIKESGDYTSQLGVVKTGDTFLVEGPYGVCSNQQMKGPFLFIAGGIGITPIRSMLKTMELSGANETATLLYANRTFEEVAFYEELNTLNEKTDWLQVVHVLSEEEREGFAHGYIGKEMIQSEVPDIDRVTVFLVGPPPMMDIIIKYLTELGVPRSRIFTEKFSLK